MLFNSIDFAVFLPIVFLLYWFVFARNLRLQNAFVIAASYLFYGWWDWRFLILIAITTLCSWASGLWIGKIRKQDLDEKREKRRTVAVTAGNIILNLGILFFFKYYNFFVESFIETFALLGKPFHVNTLKIILPVGISFYTFQALSYTIDIHRKKIEPTRDILSFFAFVSFFPQLVAGPIERATQLLPQFQRNRTFSRTHAVDGLRQMLWGLFKKVVVADQCALVVDNIFSNYDMMSGSQLAIGAVFFAFQIYGDFSGYSDIAIGCARLFGIKLMRNFNFPYFSRDIAEFWRRWHISLTTWFRDYIYIPLGGSRVGKWEVIRNTFIIFLLSGLWHGANWTFIAWGVYHALLFLPLILLGKNRKFTDTIAAGRILPNLKEFAQVALTFILVTIGWILFRADTITIAFQYFQGMLHWETFSAIYRIFANPVFWFCLSMTVIEWVERDHQYALEKLGLAWKKPLRYALYYIIMGFIIWFSGQEIQFIYFQF
ncbi:MBOAT family protein [Bacteroidales bacterium OttesenSCG-928-C03]|nr:MBOAT family protein [Bacteroidales bacterium OttesenSCG-928-C03]MDL2326699.1 MBOAT family protein [Bacteroidales bacterium OttesenSCG-928-A14]